MNMDAILKKIQSKVGKDNEDLVVFANSKKNIDFVSTGSILLDGILGGYGLLMSGRMSEVFGQEGSGKSTLCLMSMANALKKGWTVFYFDFEGALDINYAESLGIDLIKYANNLAIFKPTCLEEARSVINELETELKGVKRIAFLFDSVAAMKPKELLEKAGEQQRIGLQAQRVGEFVSYLQSIWCMGRKAAVLFTNQVRRVPAQGSLFQSKAFKSSGIGFAASNDDSFTTTGGNQLRYLVSTRIALDYAGKIEAGSYDSGDLVREGNYIRALVIKNRVAPPHTSAKLAILYGKGFVDDFAIIEVLKEHKRIESRGAVFYYYDSENNGIEVGDGNSLSFSMKGKKEFYEKLKSPEYREDMKKSYLNLMRTKEAIEIAEDPEVKDNNVSDFDEFDVQGSNND